MTQKCSTTGKFLFAVLIFIGTNIFAQWQNLSPISSSDINSIVGRGNEIYAGSYGKGIFLSTDNGDNWALRNQGLAGLEVTCLVSTGSDIFAGTYYNGLYKLDGTTWNPVNVCDEVTVHALGFCGSVIYAGINNSVYSSSDDGITWTKVHDFDKGVYVTSFAFYCCSVYAGTNTQGVYASSDGSSWTQINKGIIQSINCLVVYKQILYAGTKAGTFYQDVVNTTDSIWSYLGGPNVSITSLLFYKEKLLVGTGGYGLFVYSSNSWSQVNSSLNNKSIFAFYNSANTLFAGTKQYGVYRSTDEGTSWSLSGLGIVQNNIRDLLIDGQNIIVLNTNDGGINKTTDNGTTWIKVNDGLKNKTGLYFLEKFGDQIYTGGLNGLFKTNTSYIKWKTTGVISTTKSVFVDNQDIYTGSTDENGRTIILCSNDSGKHWSQSYVNSTGFVNQFFKTGNKLLAAHQTLGVIESDDNGTTWFENNSGLKYADPVTAWKISSAGSYLFVSTQNGLYRADASAAMLYWQPIAYFGKNVYDMLAIDNDLFAAVYGNGIFSTSDFGTTWNDINQGLVDSSIIALAYSGTNLYCASSSGGIYYRPLNELGIVSGVKSGTPSSPKNFYLDQNYPNPFNPTTVIGYQLPVAGHVTLKVFDLLGREIATIVDEYKQAGFYNYQLSTNNLPNTVHGYQLTSGVYLYRLTAGNYSATRKMILLR